MHTFKTTLLKLLPSLIVAAAIISGMVFLSKNFERSLVHSLDLTRGRNEEALRKMRYLNERLPGMVAQIQIHRKKEESNSIEGNEYPYEEEPIVIVSDEFHIYSPNEDGQIIIDAMDGYNYSINEDGQIIIDIIDVIEGNKGEDVINKKHDDF